MGKTIKDRKTYFNITAVFSMYTLITKTKGIKSDIVRLITSLQNPFIRFLVF